MIIELVNQWEENKHKLKEYFRTTNQNEYGSYKSILKKVFELCIPQSNDYSEWDLDKMTVIDDGDYQGTLIFIVPIDCYQPSLGDYVVTNTYYGSCSGCDTLRGIRDSTDDYGNGFPNEEQVKEYMTLALHLVQKLKWL
jgi:hypothetical protein